MARALPSLYPSSRPIIAGQNSSVSIALEKDAQVAGNPDMGLEDGEITDEPEVPLAMDVPKVAEKPYIEAGEDIVAEELEKRPHAIPKVPISKEAVSTTAVELVESSNEVSIPGLFYQSFTSPISVFDPSSAMASGNAPGALSQGELELAKDVVLDLLGWGVQPEYLIDCGVSSQVIHKIFTDLHLRLPSNILYPS
ncbi:hypothetical protein C0991_012180 [Blastosporella zonata]|nr:hypothetical protein C0991_012180 [Blastosporella zonata]